MNTRLDINFTAFCGLVGTLALTIYFSAPFNFLPLPSPNATAYQIFTFGNKFHNAILIDTWLQQIGTILSVIFTLSLIHLAGTSRSLSGKLTLLTCAVITSLSLAEGTFVLGAVQAGQNGHLDAALTCFELTNVFIHIFLLAPSLYLMLGFSLIGTNILPKPFIISAIILGILFQTLGALALFNTKLLLFVIMVLMLQNFWTLAASIMLLSRKQKNLIPLQIKS